MASQPGVLEIRVHGVHGTSPQNMLGTTDIGQVAGDSVTGFYRARNGALPNRTLPANVAVEAYSWGILTSGTRGFFGWLRRALWLFLLPFALANLAYWTRPCLDSDQRLRAKLSAGVIRVGALLLTLLFVVTACFVSVDLVAWQCLRGGAQACPMLPDLFDFLTRDPWQALPRRIAVAALLPIATVVLLWVLSVRSTSRLEDVATPKTPGARHLQELLPGREPILAREAMWAGGPCVVRLRRLHLAFGLLAVVGYTGLPVLRASTPSVEDDRLGHPTELVTAAADSFRGWSPVLRADAVLMAVAALVAVVVIWQVAVLRPGDVEFLDKQGRPVGPGKGGYESLVARPKNVAACWLAIAAALLIGHLMLLVAAGSGSYTESGDLFFHNVWFVGTFVTLAVVGTIAFLIERANLLGTVSGIGVMVVFVVGSAALSLSPAPAEHPVQIWAGAMAIWIIGLAVHYGKLARRPGAERLAWGGAAPSVMFNAAAWIALLFTTAAVTLSADRLNGDLSVDDLKTHYGARPVEGFLADGDITYLADGKVTLTNGIVAVSPDQVVIRSGTVTADSLGRRAAVKETTPATPQRKTAFLGDAEVSEAILELPAGTPLTLRNSCLANSATTCNIEQGVDPIDGEGFLSSSSVDVTGATLLVAAHQHHPVRLQDRSPPQTSIVLPQILIWTPIGQMVWVLLVALVAGGCWLRLRRRVRGPIRKAVESDPGIGGPDKDDCANARLRAAYTHRAERLIDAIGLATVPVVLAIIAFSGTGQPPWQLVPALSPIASIALWFSLGFALLLVLVLSQMRSNPDSRKAVGILWDLTSFWPRAAHPFAPPCYAERVVPELLARVKWALKSTESHVILSGHSQGSAIIMAVTQRLGPEHASRVRVITYGSQIRAWYGRIFPAALGPDVLGIQPTQRPSTFGNPEPDARARTEKGAPAPPPPPMRLPWWNSRAGQTRLREHVGHQRRAEDAEDARAAAQKTLEDLERQLRRATELPAVRELSIEEVTAERDRAQTCLSDRELVADQQRRAAEESAQRLNDAKTTDSLWAAPIPWWVNLYRLSDPIGFRVFSDRCYDPKDAANFDVYVQEVPVPDTGDPKPYVQGHSGFQHTAAYADVTRAWYAEVPLMPRRPPVPRRKRARFLDVRFFPEA